MRAAESQARAAGSVCWRAEQTSAGFDLSLRDPSGSEWIRVDPSGTLVAAGFSPGSIYPSAQCQVVAISGGKF